jgi:hypothetical protein
MKFWVSSHARPVLYNDTRIFRDQTTSAIERFNSGMLSSIMQPLCKSNFIYVDVFNMTNSIVQYFSVHAEDPRLHELSYDGNHFGRIVNMLKVQIFLNTVKVIVKSSQSLIRAVPISKDFNLHVHVIIGDEDEGFALRMSIIASVMTIFIIAMGLVIIQSVHAELL